MKNRQLMPLFWGMLFDMASFTIFFPVLTLVFFDNASRLFPIGTATSVRSLWYGIAFACYWVGSIIAAPLLSWSSDYIGRRKVLLIGSSGTFLFAVSLIIGVTTGQLAFILIGALIGGLCARMDPIAQAAVGDVGGKEKVLQMSYLQLFISIGAFIGPIIGGYLAQRFWFNYLNFALPFIIAAFLAFIAVTILWRYFQETAVLIPSSQRQFIIHFKQAVFNKRFFQISLLLVLMQWSWSTYYQFIAPILKKEFNFSATEIGFFMGMIAFWLAVASGLIMPILQRHFNLYKIIFFAACLAFIGLMATVIISVWHPGVIYHLVWLFAALIAMGDVISYCAVISLYSNSVAENSQGQVMGASFIIISAVWGTTALLGGWLMGKFLILPLIAALLGVTFLIIYLLVKGFNNENTIVRRFTA